MKLLLSFILIFTSLSTFAYDAEKILKPFTTDYCTAYPEGTISHPKLWAKCCVEHDLFLWAGGSREDRKQVDNNLKNCVKKSGAPLQANLIFIGVRLGSFSPIKLKDKQWGNGWIKGRKNLPLTQDEILMINDYLETHPSPALTPEEVKGFIENLKKRSEDSLNKI